MALRPEDCKKLTEKEERLLKEIELEVDSQLREHFDKKLTISLLTHFDFKSLTTKIRDEVTRRYTVAGWCVTWNIGNEQRDTWCEITLVQANPAHYVQPPGYWAHAGGYGPTRTSVKCPHGKDWNGYCSECISDHDL